MTAANQSNGNGECPFLGTCTLIQRNQTRMPNLVQRIRGYYCTGESLQCARRWIYDTLGEAFVPPLLLPNQWEWTRQIAIETEGNRILPELEGKKDSRV